MNINACPVVKDSEGWREAALSDWLPAWPNGVVVAALQAQILIGHRAAAAAISRGISREITRRLPHLIGTVNTGRGEAAILQAHRMRMARLLVPGHRNYMSFASGFEAILCYCALDAFRNERDTPARGNNPLADVNGSKRPDL